MKKNILKSTIILLIVILSAYLVSKRPQENTVLPLDSADEMIDPSLVLTPEKKDMVAKVVTNTKKFSHGITLYHTMKEDFATGFIDENLTFRQNAEVVNAYQNYQVFDLYQGDISADGHEVLLLKGFSGGAHCCFDLVIAQLKNDMPKLTVLGLRNFGETIEVKDLDNDGKKELIFYDDRYSYFASLCFASSTSVRVVTNIVNGALVLRPKLMEQFTVPNTTLMVSKVPAVQVENSIALDANAGPDVLEVFLHNLYAGKGVDAMTLIHKYLHFQNKEVEKIFFSKLLERIESSYFYRQINDLNIAKYGKSVQELFFPSLDHFFTYGDIGKEFEEGKVVKQDYAKAKKYYEKGCEVKYGLACLALANMYGNGRGVVQSDAKASEYYGKACDYGYAGGCKNWNIMNGYAPEVPNISQK